MIGAKGIPAATSQGGGIETHVEELATRLVSLGHEVSVYVRPYANPRRIKSFKGVELITLPTVKRKNLDALVHTFFATLHVLFKPADVIHYHGVGPSTLAWIPRLLKRKTKIVVTFHSRDRFHEKWRWFAKAYLAFGEWTAVFFPHTTVATSHSIQLFCRNKFNKHVWYIPNGVDIPKKLPGLDELKKFGLESGGYFFTLSRFIPHKAIEDAIIAFKSVLTDKKLLIIGFAGDNSAEQRYEKKLKAAALGDDRIIFSGRQTGETLKQLIANSYAMIHPSRSEGLSVSVLEAMSFAKLVIMSDIPENLELIDHSGVSYKSGDIGGLKNALDYVLADPKMTEERGKRARESAIRLFSWDSVVSRTEAVYAALKNI
ncbi:MAG: glycosyltransferase family 4 protein [Patescibacteria group bacterium]|nr:glycosyltransferase family 4 protein [Patescibacteria group bacterium]